MAQFTGPENWRGCFIQVCEDGREAEDWGEAEAEAAAAEPAADTLEDDREPGH